MTNYDAASIRDAEAKLTQAGLPPGLMVDCSHANSAKQHAKQEDVWRSIIEQRTGGTRSLIGVMVESYLEEGASPFRKISLNSGRASRLPTRVSHGKPRNDCCAGVMTRSAKTRRRSRRRASPDKSSFTKFAM